MLNSEIIGRVKDLIEEKMELTLNQLQEADRPFQGVNKDIEQLIEELEQGRTIREMRDIYQVMDAKFSYEVELRLLAYIAGIIDSQKVTEEHGEAISMLRHGVNGK